MQPLNSLLAGLIGPKGFCLCIFPIQIKFLYWLLAIVQLCELVQFFDICGSANSLITKVRTSHCDDQCLIYVNYEVLIAVVFIASCLFAGNELSV